MKFRIIRHFDLINEFMTEFCHERTDCFTRSGKNYVLAKEWNASAFAKAFAIFEKNQIGNDFTFIVGDCDPANDILADEKKRGLFDPELEDTIFSENRIRYSMIERDIIIDEHMLNEAADAALKSIFGGKPACGIRHNRLNSLTLVKVLTFILGKSNIKIVNKHGYALMNACDLTFSGIRDKTWLNRSSEFKRIVHEVKTYVEKTTGMDL